MDADNAIKQKFQFRSIALGTVTGPRGLALKPKLTLSPLRNQLGLSWTKTRADGFEGNVSTARSVFIAGASGYMGSRLAAELARRGHSVTGLVRARGGAARSGQPHTAGRRLPEECREVVGDALNRASFSASVAGADTYVQLVGVAHPSPSKAREFREINLKVVRGVRSHSGGERSTALKS